MSADHDMSENSTLETERREQEEDLGLPDYVKLTENGEIAYNPDCMDAMIRLFSITPQIHPLKVEKLLEKNWTRGNKLNTLKLIFLTGNARVGKMDNSNFLVMMKWLYEFHYETLLCNLFNVAEMTYAKNLLEILVLALHLKKVDLGRFTMLENTSTLDENSDGCKVESKMQRRHNSKLAFAKQLNCALDDIFVEDSESGVRRWKNELLKRKWGEYCDWQLVSSREDEKKKRKEKKAYLEEHLKNALKEEKNNKYRELQNRVVSIFASRIAKVIKENESYLAGGPEARKAFGVDSLYAKWFPNRNGRHDKITGVHSKITKAISEELEEYWCTRVTQRDVVLLINKIRRDAKVPEAFIGSGSWDEIDPNVISGRCRLLYGTVFCKHVPGYVESIAEPKNMKNVNVGGVLLHELMCKAVILRIADKEFDDRKPYRDNAINVFETTLLTYEESSALAAEQRASMGQECQAMFMKKLYVIMKKFGRKAFRALCMADVSGSMDGTPMQVAIAMGIAVSSLQPHSSSFRNKILTFEDTPKIVQLEEPVNLAEAALKVVNADWGGSTDFEKALELYLQLDKNEEREPGTLLIISDMQFNQARLDSNIPWESTYERMLRRFSEEDREMPLIIFWSVRDTKTVAIQSEKMRGVVMLGGFSDVLLESIFDPELKDRTPESELKKYLSKPELKCIRLSLSDED